MVARDAASAGVIPKRPRVIPKPMLQRERPPSTLRSAWWTYDDDPHGVGISDAGTSQRGITANIFVVGSHILPAFTVCWNSIPDGRNLQGNRAVRQQSGPLRESSTFDHPFVGSMMSPTANGA